MYIISQTQKEGYMVPYLHHITLPLSNKFHYIYSIPSWSKHLAYHSSPESTPQSKRQPQDPKN